MGNETRWYTTREAMKAAVGIKGADLDALVDSYIASASGDVETEIGRKFIPYLATRSYPFAVFDKSKGRYVLRLDEDLLSVSLLTKDGDAATEISEGDYILEPANRPPFRRIEFPSGSPSGLRVTGEWGWTAATSPAGVLAAALNDEDTVLDVIDASKVGVGDTLRVDDERLFVSDRMLLDTTATLAEGLAGEMNAVTINVDDGSKINAREMLLLDGERIFVEAVADNSLILKRAYDGSALAAHDSGASLYAYRRLVVVRAINGSEAAAHLEEAEIVKYVPPADVADLCRAEAIGHNEQGRSGWTGQIGGEAGSIETRMFNLWAFRNQVKGHYRKRVVG